MGEGRATAGEWVNLEKHRKGEHLALKILKYMHYHINSQRDWNASLHRLDTAIAVHVSLGCPNSVSCSFLEVPSSSGSSGSIPIQTLVSLLSQPLKLSMRGNEYGGFLMETPSY